MSLEILLEYLTYYESIPEIERNHFKKILGVLRFEGKRLYFCKDCGELNYSELKMGKIGKKNYFFCKNCEKGRLFSNSFKEKYFLL